MTISNIIKISSRIKGLLLILLILVSSFILRPMDNQVVERRIQLFNKKIESRASLDSRASFCGVGCGFVGSLLCCLINSNWWMWGGTCGVFVGLSVPIINEAASSAFCDFIEKLPNEDLVCASSIDSRFIGEPVLGKLSEAKSLLLLNKRLKKTKNIMLPKQIILKILRHVMATEREMYSWWKNLSEESKEEINKVACQGGQLNTLVRLMDNLAAVETAFRNGGIGLDNLGSYRLPFSPVYFEKFDDVLGE